MELKMEMSQSQVLSQRMIQSAEILQMSAAELENYIKEMALENPVMDIEDAAQIQDEKEDMRRKLEWLDSMDEQNRVYYHQEFGEDGAPKDVWNNLSENYGEDLEEYLLSQIFTETLSPKSHQVVLFMVASMDSKGYFTDDLAELARAFNIPLEQAQDCLKLIQGLEPAGVGARNLSECLLLQLDHQNRQEPVARKIITDYLELLGKNQLPAIAKKLKVSMDTVLEAVEVIKALNPKPGNSFSTRENLRYITPDVTVVKLADYYEILLNEYMYPKIAVNGYYRKLLKSDCDPEAKTYVGDKVRQAEWVMTCISQRNTTLMNVAKTLVDYQEAFFAKGPGFLRPMKLQDAAKILDIHESTVSRAVRDKYLQCSWGVYPMNYFFSKGIEMGTMGTTVATEDIKRLIVEIIEGENKKKPLSDRSIMEALMKQQVTISRRTVAKYREALGIKDASGRKTFN